MTTSEKTPQSSPSFFQRLKTTVMTFLLGTASGGLAIGYLSINADQYNLPFLSRGNNNTQSTDINKGAQSNGTNTGNIGTNTGNQVGGDNSGNVGNNTSSGTPGVGNIVAGANAKIDIKITPQDPNFQNDKLPGFFPDQGFAAQPAQLSTFEGANVFTRDLLLNGEVAFYSQKDVAIRGRSYPALFYLQGSAVQGSTETKRVTFKLDPAQKGVLLQFGMEDLDAGDTNMTYQVTISADGNRVWSGRVAYGADQQLLSVPLSMPNATALQIEYTTSISRVGESQYRPLIFTRAEQLFK